MNFSIRQFFRQVFLFPATLLFTGVKAFKRGIFPGGICMRRMLAGLALLVFAGVGSMVAQDGHYYRDNLRKDYADRRSDYRDVRHDKNRIDHDRHNLQRDRYERNYAAARYDRHEMHRDYRELRSDRHDVRHDNYKISRDHHDHHYGW